MKIELASPGKYVVAVSGGVDSMVLLRVLRGHDVVVAHLDHGIRGDSAEDRKLVQKTARKYGLQFIYKEARLGAGASEAEARTARYEFLREARREHGAVAIVTAHHQDDVLETAIINLLRGSGRKGLTSLISREDVERPLLNVPKSELVAYARAHDVTWHEDSTNQDITYVRNYVRHQLLPRFSEDGRRQLLEIITGLRTTNTELDELLARQLAGPGRINRAWFTQLPHNVARETMAAWLRNGGTRDFDSHTLERLVVAAKTAAPGKVFDVLRHQRLEVGKGYLALAGSER